MNMTEFNQVKDMTYLEYCDYLQGKYGIGLCDYVTPAFNKKAKCKRTSEGLVIHHKDEDKMILLSTKEVAEKCPFEWQTASHLVYCDMLEHLFLHVLICLYPSPEAVPEVDVGIGGVVNFIVPELNDLYSGWITGQDWRVALHNKVKDDKEVYFAILKVFADYAKTKGIKSNVLHTSLNDQFGLWSHKQNKAIYKEIDKLWGKSGLFGILS